MSKRIRQLIGIASAVAAYYLVHEGAHFLYAICTGVFKKINFMGIGVQIDVYADKMTNTQLGIFCLAGSIATLIAALWLVLLTGRICRSRSKVFKACMYYITMCKMFIGSFVTEQPTQEPWIFDQPRNALAPGPAWAYV